MVVVEELGSESFLYCTDDSAASGDALLAPQVVARAEGLSTNVPGDWISLIPPELHVFDTATGARL